MKVFKITATICLVLGLSFFGNSQTGIVSGTIIDQGFQDPVPFANVIVKDLQKGTSSDFDGSYELVLDMYSDAIKVDDTKFYFKQGDPGTNYKNEFRSG